MNGCHLKKISWLVLSLALATADAKSVWAQQNNQDPAAPPMSLLPQNQPNRNPIDYLYLDAFDKTKGNAGGCQGNCDSDAKEKAWVKAWSCIANACSAQGDRQPMECLKTFWGTMSDAQHKAGNNGLCHMVQSPGERTRKDMMKIFTDCSESGWVEGTAFTYAFAGNAGACQKYIKDFVGPYGPAWNDNWYMDMSGCRLLASQRTRADEEKDFTFWLDGQCQRIANAEMRDACKAPKAPRPLAQYGQ